MRTVSQNANEQSIWEAIPEENRHRISRILAQVIAMQILVPVEQDNDKSDAGDEPG